VLVVDDNAELRVAVVRQLTELGYVAVEAADGPAALMVLNSRPVDLLFTDVVMPGGMSGFDLARLVLARWPQMKAVITTAFPELEPVGDSITAGKLHRLLKPYRKGELAQTLAEVLVRKVATASPSA
jgi:CheY-like chemotaxis protein